jgi:hypothetical protein
MHPHLDALQPALDAAGFQLADADVHFALAPPYLVPSARFTDARVPAVLARHLLARFPGARPPLHARGSSRPTLRPPAARSISAVTVDTDLRTPGPAQPPSAEEPSPSQTQAPTHAEPPPSRFLGMNVDVMDVVDVRKWNWGALTFGKGGAKKPAEGAHASVVASSNEGKAQANASEDTVVASADSRPQEGSDVGQEPASAEAPLGPDTTPDEQDKLSISVRDAVSESMAPVLGLSASLSSTFDPFPETVPTEPEPTEPLPPVYSSTVWLEDPTAEHGTKQRRLFYVTVRARSRDSRSEV